MITYIQKTKPRANSTSIRFGSAWPPQEMRRSCELRTSVARRGKKEEQLQRPCRCHLLLPYFYTVTGSIALFITTSICIAITETRTITVPMTITIIIVINRTTSPEKNRCA